MADEAGVCNSALQKIGASQIVSLTDGSKSANYCAEQYPKLRDKLLRSHVWNFAMARAKLARLAAAPAFGFEFQYQLPADHFRVVQVHDNEDAIGSIIYKIEGLAILANAEDVYLSYVKSVTDVNEMDPVFREALASLIATEASIPLANSGTLQDRMGKIHKDDIRKARSVDAIEDFPEQFPIASWGAARGGSWRV